MFLNILSDLEKQSYHKDKSANPKTFYKIIAIKYYDVGMKTETYSDGTEWKA